jgi:hypothetical protein
MRHAAVCGKRYASYTATYCPHDTLLLTWSNNADVVLFYIRARRAIEVVVGYLGARAGPPWAYEARWGV